MVNVSTPVKWLLRLIAVGYVFFLIAWPLALIVQETFEDGLTHDDRHAQRPGRAERAAAHGVRRVLGGPDQPRLRGDDLDPAGPLRVPGQAGAVRPDRRTALGVAGRRRPRAAARLQRPHRLVRSHAGELGLPGHLQHARHDHGHLFRGAAPRDPRGGPRAHARSGTTRSRPPAASGPTARQTFLRITLPSIKWAVVYGVVLSLARSLGEFGAVKIVSGNFTGETQTATLVVEQKYQNFEQSTAYATSFVLAFVSRALHRRRLASSTQGVNTHEHRRLRRHQALRGLRRARRRLRDHPQGPADRSARAVRWWQVHAAADHRRPRQGRQRHRLHRGRRTPRSCRRRSGTSASCSSTTRCSST